MNWQEWVVGLLIVLCVARILYGIYLFFRRVKENDNPCASCASGCELKDMILYSLFFKRFLAFFLKFP